MKVLCTVRPFYSHFASLAPIALSLMERGHEVIVASAESLRPAVEGTGLAFSDAGIDPSDRTQVGRMPPGVDWDFHRSGIGSKTRDLLEIGRSWEPDVIVRDQTDLAGVIAAERLGIRHATVGLGLLTPKAWWRELLGHELDSVRAEHSLPADPSFDRIDPYLYLDRSPPSFQWSRRTIVPPITSIRPVSLGDFDTNASEPWTERLADRPTVYVTLGTVYNFRAEVTRNILLALAEAPINVVCTVGPGQDPGSFGDACGNAVLDTFIPQSRVLPYCQAVICHGGFSTLMGAYSHGLPAVIIPLGSDHSGNASRSETLGVALSLVPSELSKTTLRSRLDRLLDDPHFRRRAGCLQEEIGRLPDSSTAAELVARSAGKVAWR